VPLRDRFTLAGMVEQQLSLQERATLLEKSRLGSGLGWQELQSLAAYFDAWRADAGTYVCRQGEQSDFMCMLFQGRVRIVKEDLQHTSKEIASVGPGQVVGEMALIDGEPRSASVIVTTPVLLLVLDEDHCTQMADQMPRLWAKLLLQLARTMSKRLRQTSGVLAEYLSS